MNRILIQGATILTLDLRIGDLRGDILIEGSRIVAVVPSVPSDDAEVIPAQRMIALPGFVDSHRHTWQSLLRGAAIDWTLAQYFAGFAASWAASTRRTTCTSQTTWERSRRSMQELR